MNKKSKGKTPTSAAFDREFRETAVKLALTGAKSTAEVARELGIPPRKLYGWVAASKAKKGTPASSSSPRANDEAYLALQKKYRELEQENEILKKAAAYFARNQK
jgi:transposase